eukprot:gene6877-9419_t
MKGSTIRAKSAGRIRTDNKTSYHNSNISSNLNNKDLNIDNSDSKPRPYTREAKDYHGKRVQLPDTLIDNNNDNKQKSDEGRSSSPNHIRRAVEQREISLEVFDTPTTAQSGTNIRKSDHKNNLKSIQNGAVERSNDSNIDKVSDLLSWPQLPPDLAAVRFIKKSADRESLKLHEIKLSQQEIPHSLAYRLTASMGVDPSFIASKRMISNTFSRPTIPNTIKSSFQSNRPFTSSSAIRSNLNTSTINTSFANQEILIFRGNESSLGGKYVKDAKISYDDRPSHSTIKKQFSNIFNGMDLDDVVDYLLDAKNNKDSKNSKFVHVTPRYNVEDIKRPNFYDLVILERPGDPSTGLVWKRFSATNSKESAKQLSSYQLMQLSLQGLLCNPEHEIIDLIPLKDFIIQKKQVDYLRTGRFFARFHELKYFYLWRRYAKHSSIVLNKQNLMRYSHLADTGLISILQSISNKTYEMEENLNLFKFPGIGITDVSEYLKAQVDYFQTIKNDFVREIDDLGQAIVDKYDEYINSEKLKNIVQEIKDHHPLSSFQDFNSTNKTIIRPSTAAKISDEHKKVEFEPIIVNAVYQTTNEVDWTKLRSIQRLKEEYKERIKKLLCLAQFKVDYTVSVIIEKFWLQLKQLIVGQHLIKSAKDWKVDHSLFDDLGDVLPYAYSHHYGSGNKSASFLNVTEEDDDADFIDQQAINGVTSSSNQPKQARARIPMISITENKTLPQANNIISDSKDNTSPRQSMRRSSIHHTELYSNHASLGQNNHSSPRNRYKVNDQFETIGCHLSINVNLYINNKLFNINDFTNLNSIDKVRVMINPSKSNLTTAVHDLCGAIGDIIHALPTLRNRVIGNEIERTIAKEDEIGNKKENDENFKTENINNNNNATLNNIPANKNSNLSDALQARSSQYFTYMIMFPVYNSRNCYKLAIDTMKMMQEAYLEAIKIDNYLNRIFEIVRKLWSIAPFTLAKQIERSLILNKLKSYIDLPDNDSIADIKRCKTRDIYRLTTFKSAITYLNSITSIITNHFKNMKFSLGFVVSFKAVVDQLLTYRAIQVDLLFNRLPITFITRCSHCLEFIKSLNNTFSNSKSDFDGLLLLMSKLKNYEYTKDSFDTETDINDSVYHILVQYRKDQVKSRSTSIAIATRVTSSFIVNEAAALQTPTSAISALQSQQNPDILYRIFIESLESLSVSMNRSRSLLLTQLAKLKQDVSIKKNSLHISIKKFEQLILNINLVDISVSDELGSFLLSKHGAELSDLRLEVNKILSAQLILLEAHDIVGTAAPLLTIQEVDKFLDMIKLELLYSNKCKAWKIMLECESLSKQLLNSRVINTNIPQISLQFTQIMDIYDQLLSYLAKDDIPLLNRIDEQLENFKPKIEIISYFSARCLRTRHWQAMLNCGVFYALQLTLKFSGRQMEFINVYDIGGSVNDGSNLSISNITGQVNSNNNNTVRAPLGLGNINRLVANEFIKRGIETLIDPIRSITSDAAIEFILERTLDQVDLTLKSTHIVTSGDWVRDSRLREKIYVELNEVVNTIQLSVLLKYAMKTIMIVDQTAQDMGLVTFDQRIEQSKTMINRMDRFLENLRESQYQWMYLFHFVKFAGRGEIDRNAVRLYNSCTEELKKLEVILAQCSGNLLSAFVNYTDQDLNTDNLKLSLNSIMEDAHTNVQSMLDACPRLSLLSYNRIVQFIKLWMMGPQLNLELVSNMLSELFKGVGRLQITLSAVNASIAAPSRIFVCTGFISSDDIEQITFVEPISLSSTLEEFINEFSRAIKLNIANACDSLILSRIQFSQSIFAEVSVPTIIENISDWFSQRINQLISFCSSSHPNQSIAIVNGICFADDIWTCLGNPVGCITMCRSDVIKDSNLTLFANNWKSSLLIQKRVSMDNIQRFQHSLQSGQYLMKLNTKKAKSLSSVFLLQEIQYLRTIEELLLCRSLESAIDLWSSRFQYRFVYHKTNRIQGSPVEILLGNISVSHGLEYYGGYFYVVAREIEHSLQQVVGSSFSSRGSVFVAYKSQSDNQISYLDNNKSNNTNDENDDPFAERPNGFESVGTYSVTPQDVAYSLGRICTSFTASDNPVSVKFFLARMVYLDAIGSIDFSSIDLANLQLITSTLNSFWTALESKNDQFFQDSLKYPLKTKFSRNDLQSERRKNNINILRNYINQCEKLSYFHGIIVIGTTSEQSHAALSMMNNIYCSIFSVISISFTRPFEYIGLALSMEGYLYGCDLQDTLITAVTTLKRIINANVDNLKSNSKNSNSTDNYSIWLLKVLDSFNTISNMKRLIVKSCELLNIFTIANPNYTFYDANTINGNSVFYNMNNPSQKINSFGSNQNVSNSQIGRFQAETNCFCAALWENILLHLDVSYLNTQNYIINSSSGRTNYFNSVDASSNQKGFDATEIKRILFEPFLSKLEIISNPTELQVLSNVFQGNSLRINSKAVNAIIKSSRECGFISDHLFVGKCLHIWDEISRSNVNNGVIILLGENGVGKSAMLSTVLHSIKSVGLKVDGDYFRGESLPIQYLLAGKRILIALRRNLKLKRDERNNNQFNMNDTDLGHGSTVSMAQPGDGAGTASLTDQFTASVMSSEMDFNNASQQLSLLQEHSQFSATENVKQVQPVYKTTIYHASLSISSLLGNLDHNGKWNDGILVRKIRHIDELIIKNSVDRLKAYSSFLKKNSKTKARSDKSSLLALFSRPKLYVIVLVGPVGYYLEQLFTGANSITSNISFPFSEFSHNNVTQIVFPTSELHNLPVDNMKIVIETCDILHASPSFIANNIVIKIQSNAGLTKKTLIQTWLRSINHWLADFSPWLDFLEELKKCLLFTPFIDELLYQNGLYTAENIPIAVLMSTISTFFRVLEDLLSQCHELALPDAIFLSTRDEEDEDNEQEVRETNAHFSAMSPTAGVKNIPRKARTKGIMSLPARSREELINRARISIAYAAIWSFGGSANSSSRRNFFDSLVRDCVENYIKGEMDICTDCSVFECILNIEEAKLVKAIRYDPRTLKPLPTNGVPKKYEDVHLYAELLQKNRGNINSQLIFHTLSNCALINAIRLLLSTGGNVLVVGPHGSGKTKLINDILNDIKQNCPTPHDMRALVTETLVEVVNGRKKPEGIFAAMDILKSLLIRLTTVKGLHDDENDYDKCWLAVTAELKNIWAGVRSSFKSKSVSSTVTSLRGLPTADGLRMWLEREFLTETKYVLETPRFSYGVAFIDDLHICSHNSRKDDDSGKFMTVNRPEALLKGILASTPMFNIKRNVSVRSQATYGVHAGHNTNGRDGGHHHQQQQQRTQHILETENNSLPIMHKEQTIDPRNHNIFSDDYILQRMGIISAATTTSTIGGEFEQLMHSYSFKDMVPHFGVVGLPSMNITELHVALITGTNQCLQAGKLDELLLNALQPEIIELCRITMFMCTNLISSTADFMLTTSLERAIRSFVLLDVSLITRFCQSLQYGSVNVMNPGGLLQLFAHEWKRYFLDPLPTYGEQRSRISAILNQQIDQLDERTWCISVDWKKNLQEDFHSFKDRVWTDSTLFTNKHIMKHENNASTKDDSVNSSLPIIEDVNKPDKALQSPTQNNSEVEAGSRVYLPVELDRIGTEKSLNSGVWNRSIGDFNPVLTLNEITNSNINKVVDLNNNPSINNTNCILYPAALSLLLRIVRLLSSGNNRQHLLLLSYPGSTKKIATLLACKICQLKLLSFDVKNVSDSIVESQPSERSIYSISFIRFLKSAILSACGFQKHPQFVTTYNEDPTPTTSISSIPLYQMSTPLPVIISLENSQQLTDENRQTLLHLIDYDDPATLFDDQEIIAMIELIRKNSNMLQALKKKNSLAMNDNATGVLDDIADGNDLQEEIHQGGDDPHDHVINSTTEAAEVPDSNQIGTSTQNNNALAAAIFIKSRMQSYTGYSYQLVKNYLKQHIKTNMSLILSIEVPRTQLISNYQLADEHNVKGNSTNMKNKKQGELFKYINKRRNYQNTIDESKVGVSSSIRLTARKSSMRFTMHSNATINLNNGEANKILFDPSNSHSAYNVLNVPTVGTASTTTDTSNTAEDKIVLTVEPNSILTCPILGPMLNRRFYCIWYDIDGSDAIKGICNVIMKNEKFTYLPKKMPININLIFSTSKKQPTSNSEHEQNEDNSNIIKISQNTSLNDMKLNATSSVLSLRTSLIGNYIETKPEASTAKPAAKDSTNEVEEKSKGDKPRSFKASLVMERFNILIHHNSVFNFTTAIDTLGSIHNLGVFQCFQMGIECNPQYNDVITESIASLIDEAKIMLPHILRIPLFSDSMILSEPVVIPGSESIAELSSSLVNHIIQQYSPILLNRKLVLKTLLKGYHESIEILNHFQEIEDKLRNNNNELMRTHHKLLSNQLMLKSELDNVDKSVMKLPSFECHMMLQEDISSKYAHINYIESLSDNITNDIRKKIFGLNNLDWSSLSGCYMTNNSGSGNTNSPTAASINNRPIMKQYIELMRAIMVLINFIPPKILRGEKGSRNKMDDEMVCKCAVILLSKPNEFAAHLCGIIPNLLNPQQQNALRIMNLLLNGHIASHIDTVNSTDADRNSYSKRLNFFIRYFQSVDTTLNASTGKSSSFDFNNIGHSNSGNVNNIPSISPSNIHQQSSLNKVFLLLRNYLLLIEINGGVFNGLIGIKSRIEQSNLAKADLVNENIQIKQDFYDSIRQEMEVVAGRVKTIESFLLKNRYNIESISRNNVQKPELLIAFQDAIDIAETELQTISKILQSFVADVCIASSILFRCGFLPDNYRQEALDIIRHNLYQQYNIITSQNNPLILGNLCDRIQMSEWSNFSVGSLSRDPSSLNSMYLTHLIPFYGLIIDPDGHSLDNLSHHNKLPGYEQYIIAAAKFSIPLLEVWINSLLLANKEYFNYDNNVNQSSNNNTSNANNENPSLPELMSAVGLSIIITDVQAGCSEDLICFLASDIKCVDKASLVHDYSTKFTFPSHANSKNIYVPDIILEPNPSQYQFEHNQKLKLRDYILSSSVCTATSSSSTTLNKECNISLPCKLRLMMISTQHPVMDSHGHSSPLPLCCLKNVTILYWGSSPSSSYPFSESNPITIMTDQTNCIDQTLSNQFSHLLVQRLSPHHTSHLYALNAKINILTNDMYEKENDLMRLAYEYMSVERNKTKESLSIDSLIQQDAVSLSLLSQEKFISLLIAQVPIRRASSKLLERNRSYLREYIAYAHCIKEVFQMSINYIKTIAMFVPSSFMTPYALSSQALCTNFIMSTLKLAEDNKLFHKNKIPNNLLQIYKIRKGIVYMQKIIRNLLADNKNNNLQTKNNSVNKSVETTNNITIKSGKSTNEQNVTYNHNNKYQRWGMKAFKRQLCIQTFNFILLPLRSLFLQQIVHYVQTSMRPGLEWLPNFLFVITTWSQSHSSSVPSLKLPVDEIRTLINFALKSHGLRKSRFYHSIIVNRNNQTDSENNSNTSFEEDNLNNSGYDVSLKSDMEQLMQLRLADSKLKLSLNNPTNRIRQSNSPISLLSPATTPRNNSGNSNNMLLKSSSRSSRSPNNRGLQFFKDEIEVNKSFHRNEGSTSADVDEEYEDFIEELPGSSVSLNHRKTAYRVNEDRLVVNDTRNPTMINTGIYNNNIPNSANNNSLKIMIKNRWMSKANVGVLDGMSINTRSLKWKMKIDLNLINESSQLDDNHNYNDSYIDDLSSFGWNNIPYYKRKNIIPNSTQMMMCQVTMADECETNYYESNLLNRNDLLKPSIKIDKFELEWLRVEGANNQLMNFHQNNNDNKTNNSDTSYANHRNKLSYINGNNSSSRNNGNFQLFDTFNSNNNSNNSNRDSIMINASKKNSRGAVVVRSSLINNKNVHSFSKKQSLIDKKRKASLTSALGVGNINAMPITRTTNDRNNSVINAPASRLQNMTLGVGSHRKTLINSPLPTASRLSIHRKSSADSVNSPTGLQGHRVTQILSSQKEKNEPDISNLIENDIGYDYLFMLENHSSLSSVFKGLLNTINNNIYDFMDWKESLLSLSTVDPLLLNDVDLEDLLCRIRPPHIEIDDENNENNNSNNKGVDRSSSSGINNKSDGSGLFAKGYELSIIQSMLLGEMDI